MANAVDGGAGNSQTTARTYINKKLMPDSLEGKSFWKNNQTNTWIVIHNTAGNDAAGTTEFFHNGAQGNYTCTHFVIDDKEIYQLLELNWKGVHAGGASGQMWNDNPIPTSSCGNSNSIGIEVADAMDPDTGEMSGRVDMNKAIEVCIELVRYLMKELNIDVDHVVRHGDCSNKDCPHFIMQMNKWGYIKEQIKKRNEEGTPIQLDTSKVSSSSSSSSSGGSAGGTGTTNVTDILPNVDHRYNIANMDEVKGACLVFYPPYNSCSMADREKHFEEWQWDRKYHYIIDHTYDVNANPDDDIPEIIECTATLEATTPDTETPEDGEENENESDTGEEDLPITTASFYTKSTATLMNTIFCGDSLTVGLQQNVEGLRAHCTGGHAIHQGYDKHMADIQKETGVENVVISYGVNDAGHKQPERFKNYYIKFINAVKEAHPNANIYVNKIFPGDLSKATNDIVIICLENVPSHNAVLPDVCSATGATMLDCTSFVNLSEHYCSDGIHFTGNFYKLWAEEILRQINNGSEENSGTTPSNSNLGWTTPEVSGPDAIEDNCITIKGGFEKVENRLLQCYGLEDNNKTTYISRSLFSSHPEKHNIMIACFIPAYEDLEKDKITYEQVEKNIVNSVSKILWANGLNTKDLWREFDMNRAPSPVTYLDRDKWKDLLTEIDKQLEWRNKKFGVVSTEYAKYVAVISEYIHGSSSGSTTLGTGTSGVIEGVDEVAKTVYATLTGMGFTPEAACAVMGNMVQESGMDPTAKNKTSGALGLCQWLDERFTGLKNYAESKGKEWTDVVCQTEWAWKECLGEDAYTAKLLKDELGSAEAYAKLTDIPTAVDLWRKCFERCGEHEANDAKRLSAAQNFYSKISQGTSTSSIAPAEIMFSAKTTGTLSWPCPSTKSISSRFGPRKPPTAGASSNHKGIDIPCPSGSDVVAATDGVVVLYKEGYNYGRGNYLVIDHGGGLGTLYQHLSSATVSVGASVTNGQTVAKSGATGVGTGAHLHFEVHEGFSGTKGTPVDPEKYVSPNTATGTITGDSNGGNAGTGNNESTGGALYDINGLLVNSPHGDIVNPGPASSLPYNGNSMGGLDHDDWGGKTIYKVGEPEDTEAEKPIIENVLTSEEYKEFCDKFIMGEEFNEDGSFSVAVNFKKYWELIDTYVADFEPYDKGLVDNEALTITPNDRLNALTVNFTSNNENTFHFNVVESGPGSADHCVKSADELNVIVVPKDLKIEPIYPDLVIPPHYSTTDYDEASPNTIPLSMLTASSDEETEKTDTAMKQVAFDYNLLSGKKKETNPCSGPINFLDPYPTDDKIQELENHYPKVFIDEIESQMYSCNHPGCPIAQPMAKNFAMLQDAIMNQSKRVEQRLCKLENILSTVMRNQSRLGSRININCVYYGGQSIYGKYKCIRCLHDDRIHDGAIVTLDQCLNCTRYEPILGQCYQILDETGLNASIILDDMQMSYSDLYAMQQLNMGTLRSPQYDYVEVSGDKNCIKPEKTRIDIWKEANKEAFLKKKEDESKLEEEVKETIIEGDASSTDVELNEEELRQILNVQDETLTEDELRDMLSKTPTNDMSVGDKTVSVDDNGNVKVKQIKDVSNIKETDYIFRMDWNQTYFNQQEADVKTYPAEGIIARYKKEDPDVDYETYLQELDPELDKDVIEDVQKEMSLLGGQWVDTREETETIQTNKYSSENFYFEGFAEMKTTVTAVGSGSDGGSFGAECRSKIVEMAATIVADYDAGKAKYCQSPRTVQYDKPQSSGGKVCYDCTSFTSCCYHHAGLKSMYDKSCSGGSLIAEIVNNGGEMWLLNDEGLSKALPGDVVLKANSKVSQSDMGTKVGTSHAMVYVGDGKISHASSSKSGIKTEDLKSSFRWKDGKHFFVRPKDLIDADARAAASGSSGSIVEEQGSIDGQSYVAKISGAVCTSYSGGGGSASGLGLENGKTCASHNIPYGTKVYFPSLKDKLGGDGIVTVTDTGGPIFDFDLYTTNSIGKVNADAYVLSWGTGKTAPSYTWGLDFYSDSQWDGLKTAWAKYKSMNGQLINFLKFSQEDANVKNHKRY